METSKKHHILTDLIRNRKKFLLWLQNLKPGDEVICSSIGGCFDPADKGFGSMVNKVDRVTKTHIVIGNKKFSKNNGQEVSGSLYHSAWIEYPEPKKLQELDEALNRKSLIASIKDVLELPNTTTQNLKNALLALKIHD